MKGRNDEGDREALAGARADRRVAAASRREPPTTSKRGRNLLEGALHAGAALAAAGLGLAHAMAQALGGRFGLPHGAMNALTLPPALRFNAPVAEREIARFGAGAGHERPGRPGRRSSHGSAAINASATWACPKTSSTTVAEAAADRPGAQANPRPANSSQISGLLRSHLLALRPFPPALSHTAPPSPASRAPSLGLAAIMPTGGCSSSWCVRMLPPAPERTLKPARYDPSGRRRIRWSTAFLARSRSSGRPAAHGKRP